MPKRSVCKLAGGQNKCSNPIAIICIWHIIKIGGGSGLKPSLMWVVGGLLIRISLGNLSPEFSAMCGSRPNCTLLLFIQQTPFFWPVCDASFGRWPPAAKPTKELFTAADSLALHCLSRVCLNRPSESSAPWSESLALSGSQEAFFFQAQRHTA